MNNVEVIRLNTTQLATMAGENANPTAIINIQSHMLTTQFQPVSIVITGMFEFNAVTVHDDISKNYEDKVIRPDDPEENDNNHLTLITVVIVLVLAVVGVSVFIMYVFEIKMTCSSFKLYKQKKAVGLLIKEY